MTQHWHSTYVDGCFRCDLSRAELVCDDCGHQVSQHSSEGGVGCLHVVHKFHSLERPGHVSSVLTCPCLRTGTSRADQ